MATSKLAIHVLPDSNPENISQTITLLAQLAVTNFAGPKHFVSYLREQGVNANEWVQSTSASMGILEKNGKLLRLSSLGQALARLRDDVRGDILHYLMYTGWDASDPLEFLQSWGYRHCCDRYWDEGEVTLDASYLNLQVEATISEAGQTFGELADGAFDGISFSRKSLRGVYKWLDALHPPVLQNNKFVRRLICPPELLILAIGDVLRDEEVVTDVDILLTREKREAICRVCLLAPEGLDRALDWAIPTFPSLIGPGTTAGFYGRFIRLYKRPTVEDIVR